MTKVRVSVIVEYPVVPLVKRAVSSVWVTVMGLTLLIEEIGV